MREFGNKYQISCQVFDSLISYVVVPYIQNIISKSHNIQILPRSRCVSLGTNIKLVAKYMIPSSPIILSPIINYSLEKLM